MRAYLYPLNLSVLAAGTLLSYVIADTHPVAGFLVGVVTGLIFWLPRSQPVPQAAPSYDAAYKAWIDGRRKADDHYKAGNAAAFLIQLRRNKTLAAAVDAAQAEEGTPE